jgi:putative membrane protein
MNIKTPLALAVAALLLVGTTACNRNDDAAGGTNNTPSADTAAADAATATQPTGPAVPPGTDAATTPSQTEALALLNAVNDHEIKAAEMAKSKNVTGPVLEYANMMQAEHGKNMTDTNALMQQVGGANANANAGAAAGAQAGMAAGTAASAGADSARVNEQRAKAEAKRAQMQGLEGEAFARAYIDAMVTDHAETLTLIDSMLLPAASDEAVKNHLTMTRQHVQQHHDRARQIQTQLGGANAGAAGGGTGG